MHEVADYNASDTKQVRAAAKAAKIISAERQGVVLTLMSSPAGRAWVRDWLERCHVFHTPFTGIAATTDFNCGEQNIGLGLLGEVVSAAPDQYIQMMRESADKEQANGRRSDDNDGHQRDRTDDGWADSGPNGSGSVQAEYQPGADED